MKTTCWILFAMVISGCIVDESSYRITHPDVMYVGDSLCHRVFDVDTGIPHIYENDDRWRTASEHEDGRTFAARAKKVLKTFEDGDFFKPCECTI